MHDQVKAPVERTMCSGQKRKKGFKAHIIVNVLTIGLISEVMYASCMRSISRLLWLKNWPWDMFRVCKRSDVKCLASMSVVLSNPDKLRAIEARQNTAWKNQIRRSNELRRKERYRQWGQQWCRKKQKSEKHVEDIYVLFKSPDQ
jgi:hypothetical protein